MSDNESANAMRRALALMNARIAAKDEELRARLEALENRVAELETKRKAAKRNG